MPDPINIYIHDAVYSEIMSKNYIPAIRKFLSIKKEYWIQGPYRKERREGSKSFVSKKGIFFTGFIPRIKKKIKHYDVKIHHSSDYINQVMTHDRFPFLKGIKFRDDQLNVFEKILEYPRGIILHPPGIGKTILGLGLISAFPNHNSLFLCGETTLLRQTETEMKKRGLNPSMIGDSSRDPLGKITLGMIQSIRKIDPENLSFFDAVFVDETHIGIRTDSVLSNILSNMIAPIRIGLTATLPENDDSLMNLEGLIGPVIANMTIEEGVKMGLLARPKIRIIKTPFDPNIRELRSFNAVYQAAIVKSRFRNRTLVKVISEYMEQGKTAVIFVLKIEHGKILQNLFYNLTGERPPFIYGIMPGIEREKLKLTLNEKRIKCIIADVVWTHGINIPTLDVIADATGGKSIKDVLQKLGRGLRKTDDKTEMIFITFFDPSHPYLIDHFGEQISFFCEQGWL